MGKKARNRGAKTAHQRPTVTASPEATLRKRAELLGCSIRGDDDSGKRYEGLAQLWRYMGQQRDVFYACNRKWWVDGYEHIGQCADADAYAMIGDDLSDLDLAHSRGFLELALQRR